jgi:hypothetical protein
MRNLERSLGNSERRSAWSSLIAFLGSSRFGLILPLILDAFPSSGCSSSERPARYTSPVRQAFGSLVQLTGLGTVYRGLVVPSLITLVLINLLVCSAAIRRSFRQAPPGQGRTTSCFRTRDRLNWTWNRATA